MVQSAPPHRVRSTHSPRCSPQPMPQVVHLSSGAKWPMFPHFLCSTGFSNRSSARRISASLKRLLPIVRRINELDEQFKSISDDDLRAKTRAWRDRLAPVEEPSEREAILTEILPEAFAVVKNGARRLCRQKLDRVRPGRHLEHDPLRRAAHRRDGIAFRPDRRNGHRRRQNARRHPTPLPQRPHRPRLASRHCQ